MTPEESGILETQEAPSASHCTVAGTQIATLGGQKFEADADLAYMGGLLQVAEGQTVFITNEGLDATAL